MQVKNKPLAGGPEHAFILGSMVHTVANKDFLSNMNLMSLGR